MALLAAALAVLQQTAHNLGPMFCGPTRVVGIEEDLSQQPVEQWLM